MTAEQAKWAEQIRPQLQGIGVEVLKPGALERVVGDFVPIERAGDTVGMDDVIEETDR